MMKMGLFCLYVASSQKVLGLEDLLHQATAREQQVDDLRTQLYELQTARDQVRPAP
jgi:hypothetical protein